jgi:FAD-dependent urate hydroxylase
MKVVIIGAGIAGLTLAVYLQRHQIEVCINERAEGTLSGGHAFLMHSDGLAILKEMIGGTDLQLPGKRVDRFSLKTPEGRDLQEAALGAWQCIKRTDLTSFLYKLLDVKVNDGSEFSHFLYHDQKVMAAVFNDGRVEYGDVFVGADGGFSKVRSAIAGPVEFKAGGVREVVGIAHQDDLAAAYAGKFIKFQEQNAGLAFGLIPTSTTELVWFMQYDPCVAELTSTRPEALSAFCQQQLKTFPAVVQDVLKANDFQTTYLWNTRDFDLLPRFHKDNVVLIGDAAHLALPFTSAGTTNAMVDARLLADLLQETVARHHDSDKGFDLEPAFSEYYENRSAAVLKHLEFGRKLRDAFLNPVAHVGERTKVPLIS